MKNIIKTILPVLIAAGLAGCDTAGGIDNELFSAGTNGALASWVSSPDGDLILSNTSSSIDFEVEFIDENGGNTVEAFTLSVSDGTTTATVLNQTTFSANSGGNQGFSGGISLADIASALSTTTASFSEGDEFSFSSTITRGGVVYPVGAASQFLDAVSAFDWTIATETVLITSFAVDNTYLNSSSVDTVVIGFANDFTSELVVLPTITRNSITGNTDDVIGTIQYNSTDEVYWFLYSAGAAANDTISFTITNASALATGFVVADSVFSNNYIIDNATPVVLVNSAQLSFGSGGTAIGYRYNIVFNEDIGNVTFTADFTGVDDDGDGDIDGADADGDSIEISVSAVDDILDYTFDWSSADGEVTLTLEVQDKAGNALGLGTVVLN